MGGGLIVVDPNTPVDYRVFPGVYVRVDPGNPGNVLVVIPIYDTGEVWFFEQEDGSAGFTFIPY